MTALTLPISAKSNYPGLTLVLLLLVICAFCWVAWRLTRHHGERRKERRLGIDRRHDGRHGNH